MYLQRGFRCACVLLPLSACSPFSGMRDTRATHLHGKYELQVRESEGNGAVEGVEVTARWEKPSREVTETTDSTGKVTFEWSWRSGSAFRSTGHNFPQLVTYKDRFPVTLLVEKEGFAPRTFTLDTSHFSREGDTYTRVEAIAITRWVD